MGQSYFDGALNKTVTLNPQDSHQFVTGFGLIQLSNALGFKDINTGASRVPVIYAHEGTLSRMNQFQTFVFDVAEGNANFSATLVWSDPAAAMAAEVQLVNDLDLVVYRPDCGSEQGNSYLQLDLMTDSRFRETYRSRHGRFKDRNNNAERVFLERPPAGRYVVEVSSYSLNEGPQPFALVVNFQRSSGMNYTSCPEVTYLACDSYLEDANVTVELVLNHPEFSASSWENDVASLMAIAANERVANARLVPGHNASSPNTVNFIMKDVKLDCRPRQQTRWNPDLRQPSTRYLADGLLRAMARNPSSAAFSQPESFTRFINPNGVFEVKFSEHVEPASLLWLWITLGVVAVLMFGFVGLRAFRKEKNAEGLRLNSAADDPQESEVQYRAFQE